MRTRLAPAVGLLVAAVSCAGETHEARWTMTWSWAGASRDVPLGDPGFTCGDSRDDAGNVLAMLRSTRIRACDSWCAERSGGKPTSACSLQCNREASFAGGRCETRSKPRSVPMFAK